MEARAESKSLDQAIQRHIDSREKKHKRVMLLIAGILFILMLLSLSLGEMKIPVSETFRILVGKALGSEALLDGVRENAMYAVWEVRLPRILTGILVGAGLAVSGTVFQAILSNPLADPYTIGVSTGAAFGASVAIVINLLFATVYIPILPLAFIGACGTLYLVISISRVGGRTSSNDIILAGIIVGSILSAGISYMKVLANEDVSAIVFWIMGSLSARSWLHVAVAFPVIALMIIWIIAKAEELDIMSLGKIESNQLGVDYESKMRKYMILASLITATCVSVSGIIGFVGLVVPHFIRMRGVATNRRLLSLAAVCGGLVLLVADMFSRNATVVEIPVGVYTSLLGGPFFIWIFLKRKKGA